MLHSVTKLPHPNSFNKGRHQEGGISQTSRNQACCSGLNACPKHHTSCKQGCVPHLQPSKAQQLLQRAVELIHCHFKCWPPEARASVRPRGALCRRGTLTGSPSEVSCRLPGSVPGCRSSHRASRPLPQPVAAPAVRPTPTHPRGHAPRRGAPPPAPGLACAENLHRSWAATSRPGSRLRDRVARQPG